ncbi:MAG: nucleotide exchange factor GrpE [Bacilli bacterium]
MEKNSNNTNNEKIKVKSVKEKKDTVKKKTNNKDKELIEKLEKENSNLNDKVLRLSAEMQNMRRRYDEEINKICKYEGEELVIKLLTIIDNFERAIKLDDRDLTDELSKFLSGFKMIYTNLLSILEAMEVKEINCKGIEFDPNIMEAVITEKDENLPANVVIEVLQKGYIYKDKVIRVAMVKVNE